MEQLMLKLQEWSALFGLKLVAALAILILGRLAARGLRSVVQRMMRKSGQMDETLVTFTSSLVYFGAMAFVIIACLGQLGVQTASFVALLGAAGLAVGLALQGSLSNFAAGVLLILFKPFKVGDYIEGGGMAGSVDEIGIFTTTLNSPDNKRIIVPNAAMTSSSIVNYSARDTRRVDLVAGVSYSDDLDLVKKVLAEILANDPRVLADPPPTIGVLELADSSVNLAVRPWVRTEDYWNVYFATQEAIKKTFDARGISIPFPQQDVHLHRMDA